MNPRDTDGFSVGSEGGGRGGACSAPLMAGRSHSGTLLVAEVASRFEDIRAFMSAMAQLGFKSVSKVRPQAHRAPRGVRLPRGNRGARGRARGSRQRRLGGAKCLGPAWG